MPKLSDPVIIRGKKIKNRIVMPPMVCFSFKGDHGGMYGEQHVDHYTKRAKGGAGLIIVQSTPVSGAAGQLGVWSSEQMRPLEAIARNCHGHGSTVMIQLSCGNIDINELAVEQIHKMQEDCLAAAASAKRAGFDGVEYHFAHGFTLCKFLDPNFNKRTDAYGGAVENRIRIIAEILPQIRGMAGEDFIISIRMGGNIPDVTGAAEVAMALEKAGADLLHISFGMEMPANTVPVDFNGSVIAYNGSEIKKQVHIPVIGVFEIFTGEQAKFLIEQGYLDFVAVGRGMLADENWANKVLAGEPVNQCHNCGGGSRGCLWFDDHTQCPAGKKLSKDGHKNAVIENILTRRSIRQYKEQQIADEDLNIILDAAKYAPSGGNSQTWHFTVLQNKERLLQLNEYIRAGFEKLEVDENTYRSIRAAKAASKNDLYNFYYHAPALIIVSNETGYVNAMADSACALENMFLAAHSLNLGSCWINQVSWLDHDQQVRSFLTGLGIPPNHKVCGSVCLGYRDGEMPVAKDRKENTLTIIK